MQQCKSFSFGFLRKRRFNKVIVGSSIPQYSFNIQKHLIVLIIVIEHVQDFPAFRLEQYSYDLTVLDSRFRESDLKIRIYEVSRSQLSFIILLKNFVNFVRILYNDVITSYYLPLLTNYEK